LRGLPKIHKPGTPIRPVVNWQQAPAYRIAKLLTDTLKREVPLPNAFNVNNSIHLMDDLKTIHTTNSTTLASFDITDMYTNIPTKEIPGIITTICRKQATPTKTKTKILELTRTILNQNYFQFMNQTYKQTTGLAMGAPTSPIFSEFYLQHKEHTTFHRILQRHKIIGYFRFVDDILLIFDNTVTDINQVLSEFNSATPSLQFTMELETDNRINFLDLTIRKNNGHFEFEIYRKPTCTDIIIPQDSCHPTEHKISAIRYLHNRNNTYSTNQDSKMKEHAIINQILHNNRYDQSQTSIHTKRTPLPPRPHQRHETKEKMGQIHLHRERDKICNQSAQKT
jgi:hypothetical protein